MGSKIIIASNRLPVTLSDKEGGLAVGRSTGGLAIALDPVRKQYDTIWVGWSGLRRSLEPEQIEGLGLPKSLSLVDLDDKEAYHYYDRVANSALFPAFLNLEPLARCTPKDWKVFMDVSRRFARAIQQACEPDDVIWLHDYHLVLVPQLLREAGVMNRIGFFLHAHAPFPAISPAKQLPESARILRSLAQVDVLGFQTPHYASAVYRAMSKQFPPLKLPEVIESFPIGVDFGAYRQAVTSPEIRQLAAKIRQQKTKGRKVILSASRLDYVKGIIQQLRAVERLLADMTPKQRERWVYKLVVAPSRENLGRYRQLKEEIQTTVAEINARLGTADWQPMLYRYETLGFDELTAWYHVADVLLATPRVDGMNLIVKEYVAAHPHEGSLVLSRTAGAAFQMEQAVIVENPKDIDSVAAGLRQAITMPAAERARRWRALRDVVRQEDIFWWTDRFLEALLATSRNVELDALPTLMPASGMGFKDLGAAAPPLTS
jgi:trehalose 6-phosphate synthase/phosphatase